MFGSDARGPPGLQQTPQLSFSGSICTDQWVRASGPPSPRTTGSMAPALPTRPPAVHQIPPS
ncbi:hypothetical protein EYF80_052860 [Liparis tanakae]|uniref:Uncharacterized protein n=1 Tax=Liparis tanakae TaxID=230148 RepID=A0A4Z2F7J4_9TELE|nr:hypothetical protein EYF80_052860 [Liparis tanakae]